jgi:hypothetical protein
LVRFVATAAALGAGWFVVLLVPGVTREWLLAGWLPSLACLVAASVLVALPARRWIARAETFGARLLRAVLVPAAGCVLYLTLWAALAGLRGLAGGETLNAHDLLSLYATGLAAAAASFWVVVPYGYLCQVAMEGRARAAGGDGA